MSTSIRIHTASTTPQRTEQAIQPARTSKDGSVRQTSKLAKKSTRLPAAVNLHSKRISTQPQMVPATLQQLRDQVRISHEILSPPPNLRTPSLVSGSSVSTHDSPRSNVLRRKPSTIGKFVARKRSEAAGLDDNSTMKSDGYGATDDTVFNIPMPYSRGPPSLTPVSIANSDSLYATTSTAISNTPSTRYTGSPFSHAPTPSSFSSQSTVPTSYSKISPVVCQEKARTPRYSLLGSKEAPKVIQAGQNRINQVENKRTSQVRPAIPELAHLNTAGRSTRSAPVRPSRDGASGLNIAQPTSPVVQSDLPLATFHKRTSSRDSIASVSSHGFRQRFGLSPKLSTERPSPIKGKAMVSADSDVESVLETSNLDKPRLFHSPAPLASPAPSKRFGFLTRKPKDEVRRSEKPKREPRKMPTAGTGHERYGRFGFGGRSGSISSSVGGRSPSTDSVSSGKSSSFLRRKSSGASDKTSELDEFLRDRLTPVVLRGGNASITTTSSAVETTPALSQSSMEQSRGLEITGSLQSQRQQMVSPVIDGDDEDDFTYINDAPHTDAPEAHDGHEGLWLRPLNSEHKQPRKWNFLQRLQSSPSKQRPPAAGPSKILHRDNFDSAAHSALMDAIEPIDLIEVEKLVMEDEAITSQPLRVAEKRRSLLPSPLEAEKQSKKRTSTLAQHNLRSIPKAQSGQKKSAIHEVKTPDLGADQSPRIPRLSPIGRIPPIVSKRDRERKLPDVSFSRPFASTQPRPNVKPPGALYNQIRELASPIESLPEEFPRPVQEQRLSRSGDHALHSATNFLSFPSRKNSDFSYSSSSDTASWMAYSRMQALQDEDVWDEYDEFMNDAALGKPSTYHKTSFSSHQSPQYRDTPMQDASYFGLPPTREPNSALPQPPGTARLGSNSSITQPSIYSMTRAVLSRDSTMSCTSVSSSRNSRISMRSRAASFGDTNIRSSNTSFSSARMRDSMKAAGTQDTHSYFDLKLESLMTSKLLSFGRVLFSPAHNEMGLADEPRILILDGLGSDWSYFVAMSYPKATIYNLGPSGRRSNSRDGVQQLPNHRNIAHTTIGTPLPFPKGFFNAAVFRFPIATTDQAYHSCVTEFKRVLRPGGYLEVTVLDIDLGNAGDRARRAVRGLKTRMQQREENISLRSLSDFVLQSIGKRGFEEVQRCIIGVPVMCRDSRNSDSGSISSDTTTTRTASKRSNATSDKALISLVESAQQVLIESETSDEKMTRSVARVGRWWYTQCYERSVLGTDQSIWSNHGLLSECQQQNTSLRLLICYAQKPSQARRRTMSV